MGSRIAFLCIDCGRWTHRESSIVAHKDETGHRRVVVTGRGRGPSTSGHVRKRRARLIVENLLAAWESEGGYCPPEPVVAPPPPTPPVKPPRPLPLNHDLEDRLAAMFGGGRRA